MVAPSGKRVGLIFKLFFLTAIGKQNNIKSYFKLVMMARKVKTAAPWIMTIFGGVKPTIRPDSFIAEKSVDDICLGERVYSMLDLFESLQRGKSISTIQNLWEKESVTVQLFTRIRSGFMCKILTILSWIGKVLSISGEIASGGILFVALQPTENRYKGQIPSKKKR